MLKEILNHLFEYRNGKLFWKPLKERGFRHSGLEAGTMNKGRVYVKSSKLPKKNFARSQIVWIMHNGDIPFGMMVDHRDRNPLNDRIENLRLLTNAENCANQDTKCSKKSNLPKGVYNCTAKDKYRFQAVRYGKMHSVTNVTYDEAVKAAEEFFKQDPFYN